MLKLYKKMGETPLECLGRLQTDNPKYEDVKLTYAGRLDPMAEGELLVLVGEECKDKDNYLGLDKEYEFEVLLGFETDTYDILGLLRESAYSVGGVQAFEVGREDYDVGRHQGKMERFLESIKGKQMQKYPAFSSKTIEGKPMFELAKVGKLEGKEIPKREIEIYEADLIKSYWITGSDLMADVLKRILLVKGDFRQDEILEKWKKALMDKNKEQFLVSRMKIKCSSGTYVRGLVNSLSKRLSYPALAFKIKRLKIFD